MVLGFRIDNARIETAMHMLLHKLLDGSGAVPFTENQRLSEKDVDPTHF
jgi:hypothetical protein